MKVIDGIHLIIDAKYCNPDKLKDEKLLKDTLNNFPGELQMNKIAPAVVHRYIGAKPDDWGISGLILIAESHIIFHTFPEHRFVWVDIFSCKEFQITAALGKIKKTFQAGKIRHWVLNRGIHLEKVANTKTFLENGNVLDLTSRKRLTSALS